MPTIVRRARLGNSTEDISYVGNGQMAVLDGYDLFLVPLAQVTDPRARTRKLFDVRGLGRDGRAARSRVPRDGRPVRLQRPPPP